MRADEADKCAAHAVELAKEDFDHRFDDVNVAIAAFDEQLAAMPDPVAARAAVTAAATRYAEANPGAARVAMGGVIHDTLDKRLPLP